MSNRQQEQVRVEVDEIKEGMSTLKALAVTIDDKLEWVPRSQVHSFDAHGDPPFLMVTPFIAKKLGAY